MSPNILFMKDVQFMFTFDNYCIHAFVQTVTRSSRLLQQAKESINENTNRSLMLMKKQKLYAEFGEVMTSFIYSCIKVH